MRRVLAASLCAFALALVAPAAALGVAPPALSVTSADLIEQTSGHELYGVDPNSERPIASATKIMTALIVLEHVKHLGVIFRQNNFVASAIDSQIGLAPGERMSVHDLLLALLLPSADDAAEDLAYNVGHGSVARFVAMMNTRARQLGLTHTHYSTPIGLDTPGNYSSASDLVKLASYVLGHSAYFARVVALHGAVLHSGRYARYIVNRNDLVGRVPWVDGVKTGHTAGAGYVLVIAGTRHGMRLIGAVLGTSSMAARDANALALLDYGFAEYRIIRPVRAGEVLARPTVKDSPGKHATVVADDGYTRIVRSSADITTKVSVPRQLAGPLPKGAIVGQVTVSVDGREVTRIPLVLARRLPAVSPLTVAARFLTRTSTLILLGLVLGAMLLVIALRRARVRDAKTDRLEAG
jgi:D-alanyl-D-alanine carboxypeptidase (penicillin-binding protein 5/6)